MTGELNANLPKTFAERVHDQNPHKVKKLTHEELSRHRSAVSDESSKPKPAQTSSIPKHSVEELKSAAAAHGYKTDANGTIISGPYDHQRVTVNSNATGNFAPVSRGKISKKVDHTKTKPEHAPGRNPDGSFISIGSIGPGTVLFAFSIYWFFFRK